MNKRSVITIVCLVLGYWAISMTKSLATKDGNLKLSSEEVEARQTVARSPAEAKPSGMVAVTKADIPPPPETKPPVLFESQAELNVYAGLKTKVLPSDAEKSEKQRLLNNKHVIADIAARLITIPLIPLGQQDVAIDFLVDALKGGDKAATEEAMRAIVRDMQVEDTKLAVEVREQLAGIKAEILYNWAALAPDEQGDIARQLPGPASERIWRNVQDAHASNLAEH